MSEALFEVPCEALKPKAARKWTERQMLDTLAARYLKDSGNGPRYVFAEHVRNQGGFGKVLRSEWPGVWRSDLRTADALAIDLWPSNEHLIHGFEVKVSRSDWLTELKDPSKAEAFRPFCDHWWLVVPDTSIVRDDLPPGWGLLALDAKETLRIKQRAPRNHDRQPMPQGMLAAWLRAAVKTAERGQR